MKALVTIGGIVLALLLKSEIVTLLIILAAVILFLGKVVSSNEYHSSW